MMWWTEIWESTQTFRYQDQLRQPIPQRLQQLCTSDFTDISRFDQVIAAYKNDFQQSVQTEV